MTRFLRGRRASVPAYRLSPPVTIRWATAADAKSIAVIAGLDEATTPPAPLLLGFVADELWAAVSASTRELIADPFRPSAEVALLVAERARQLTIAQPRRPRLDLRLRAPQKTTWCDGQAAASRHPQTSQDALR